MYERKFDELSRRLRPGSIFFVEEYFPLARSHGEGYEYSRDCGKAQYLGLTRSERPVVERIDGHFNFAQRFVKKNYMLQSEYWKRWERGGPRYLMSQGRLPFLEFIGKVDEDHIEMRNKIFTRDASERIIFRHLDATITYLHIDEEEISRTLFFSAEEVAAALSLLETPAREDVSKTLEQFSQRLQRSKIENENNPKTIRDSDERLKMI